MGDIIGLINEYGVWVLVPLFVIGYNRLKQSIEKHEKHCEEWCTNYDTEQRELRAEQRELRGMVAGLIQSIGDFKSDINKSMGDFKSDINQSIEAMRGDIKVLKERQQHQTDSK